MSRRTALRIAAPILAVAVLVAVVIVGLRLAAPAQAPGPPPGSTTLTTGGCDGLGICTPRTPAGRCDGLGICTPRGTLPATTPCSSKVATDTVDGVALQSWPACTAEDQAILSVYRSYMVVYRTVLTDPYGHVGETPRQILGGIYAQEAQGTAVATKIPTGCQIPTNIVHAVSWPAACDQLVAPTSKPGVTGPLAYAAKALSSVATPAGVSVALNALSHNLDAGYSTSGTITRTHDAAVRQVVSTGKTYTTNAPNPAQAISNWTPVPAKAAATTAVVWACWTTHLVATSTAGQRRKYPPYWAVNMSLVQTPKGWYMNGMEVLPTTRAASKGAPCGAAY